MHTNAATIRRQYSYVVFIIVLLRRVAAPLRTRIVLATLLRRRFFPIWPRVKVAVSVEYLVEWVLCRGSPDSAGENH